MTSMRMINWQHRPMMVCMVKKPPKWSTHARHVSMIVDEVSTWPN
jgi:hypothetical protein